MAPTPDSAPPARSAKAPYLLSIRSSRAFITTTIATAVFTDIFLYASVVPVLPFALTTRCNIPASDVQHWTSIFLAVYGAALAVASPICGFFADRSTSRRLPLLLGLLALGGATAMLTAGNSLAVLLTGRALQGLSASVVWTVGLALLSDTVKKEEIGKAMGWIGAATSAGSLCGPLLGGVVYDRAGYVPVFAMGLGLIGLDVLLRFVMVEKVVARQWIDSESELDGSTEKERPSGNGNGDGDVIVAAPISQPGNAILSVKYDSTQGIDFETSNPPTVLQSEATSSTPRTWQSRLPPFITLLAVPRILVALFGCFVQSISLAAFDTTLPLYVSKTFHWTSLGAGLIFVCLVIPALFSPLIGTLSDMYGSRAITTLGLLGSVPFWVCFRFVTYSSMGQKVLLCALLVGLGFCMAAVMSPLMADLDHAVALEEKRRPKGSLGKRGAAAQGFGLFNFAFAVGTLVGPLWAGAVVQNAGWGTMVWSMGLLSGVCAAATFCWTGGRIMLRGGDGSVV